MPRQNRAENWLHGKSLLLSASVPVEKSNRYIRRYRARLDIEEAVISLARATFAAGGRLVYGGDPSIALLLTMVAAEYLVPRFAEGGGTEEFQERPKAMLSFYQTLDLKEDFPEIQQLADWGYLSVPSQTNYQGPDMIHLMIKEADPVAMVCIGGTEKMEKEVMIFSELRPHLPIYLISTSGGAAEFLSQEDTERRKVIDREVIQVLKTRIMEMAPEKGEKEESMKYVPYPLIMQKIIHDLSHETFGEMT
jgi:hypothetical protein